MVIAQWVGGAVVGAGVWVGFRYLWYSLPVVALALAVVLTVGLVLGVRALLRNDDLRTTMFAVLVGLLLTVSPGVARPAGQVTMRASGTTPRYVSPTAREIPVALSTASVYPEGVEAAFEIAAELGYDGVELMVWTDPVSQDVRRRGPARPPVRRSGAGRARAVPGRDPAGVGRRPDRADPPLGGRGRDSSARGPS